MAPRHQPARDLLAQAARTESVSTPGYDPTSLRPGIAHIGVGNFHRAHQAAYLDDLAGLGGAVEWGIRGLGLLHQDSRIGHALHGQGMAYTLTTRSPEGSLTRAVASIVDHVDLLTLAGGAERALTDEGIRIVTLTIGEGGYVVPDAGNLQATLPLPDPGDQRPQVHFLELLYRALKARRKLGYEPFTVATCDNLVRNGHRAQQALVGYVDQFDPAFATWITANVSFPSSMVDRITPRTTDADREAVQKLGVDDAWPVVTEPFRQWVVEDSFPAGRPDLEAVGVTFVTDVEPYERAKFRLLNASHQILSYLGGIAGYEYVHDAVRDPLMRVTLRQFMSSEATPTLMPGAMDYDDYGTKILDRFANPYIADTLARLRFETSTMYPSFVRPILLDQIRTGGSVRFAAAHAAAWAHWLTTGNPVEDRNRSELIARAQSADWVAFVDDPAIFGSAGSDARFRQSYIESRELISGSGVVALLHDLATPSLHRDA